MTTKAQYEDLATRLAEASRRLRTLTEAKSKADIRLGILEEELKKLQDQCISLYGTANPDELEALAAEKYAKAEQIVTDFSSKVSEIAGRLAAMQAEQAPGA